MIKYKQELDKLLKDIFFEEWMDEQEWKDYLSILFITTGSSLEIMSKELENAINMGYTLEEQLEVSKKLLKTI